MHPPLELGVKKKGVRGEAEEAGELDSKQYSAFLLMTQSDIEHIELCASNGGKHQPKALQSLYKLKCLKKTEVLCKNSAASLVQFSQSLLQDPQVCIQKTFKENN